MDSFGYHFKAILQRVIEVLKTFFSLFCSSWFRFLKFQTWCDLNLLEMHEEITVTVPAGT